MNVVFQKGEFNVDKVFGAAIKFNKMRSNGEGVNTPMPYDRFRLGEQHSILTPNTRKLYEFGESNQRDLHEVFRSNPAQVIQHSQNVNTSTQASLLTSKPQRPHGHSNLGQNASEHQQLGNSEASKDMKSNLLSMINNSANDPPTYYYGNRGAMGLEEQKPLVRGLGDNPALKSVQAKLMPPTVIKKEKPDIP